MMGHYSAQMGLYHEVKPCIQRDPCCERGFRDLAQKSYRQNIQVKWDSQAQGWTSLW